MDTAPVISLPQTAFIPFLSADALIPLVFYVAIAAYAIFTAVFYYHWNSYAEGGKVMGLTYIVYFVTTLPLLGIMATLALL